MTEVLSEEQGVVRRAQRAAERFRACHRTHGLLARILPDTDEGHALDELRDRLARDFNALVTLEGAALDEALRGLESAVHKYEQDLEALDRAIPMGWFRGHFDASQASSVALADYASLLGRQVGDSPVRLDRIQFLLTRVVSFFLAPEDATTARRRELLAEALPQVEIDDESRQTAVAFLRDAAQRATGFKRLAQIVSSGFFVDVRGYKLSLRTKLLDPDVMAAAIELNEAVNDNLRRLAEADAPAGKEIEAHLADVDQRIKSIFQKLREDETATELRFEHWLRRNAQKRARKAAADKPLFKPAGRGKKVHRRVVMGAVLAALLLVMWARWPSRGSLAELPPQELAALCAVLKAGAVGPAHSPKIFVGQIDPARWALMSLDARREAASALATKLRERGLLAGTVMMEQQVVIQVEGGRLILVQ
ncbi:MAG: hypothetical protein IT380_09395 [Myxococcales bacterium]|nr:hypothetical protein [Myxococcales bacterium]